MYTYTYFQLTYRYLLTIQNTHSYIRDISKDINKSMLSFLEEVI